MPVTSGRLAIRVQVFVLLIVVRIVGERKTIKVVQEFLSWKNQHSWSQSLLAFEFDETDVSLCHEIEIDIREDFF